MLSVSQPRRLTGDVTLLAEPNSWPDGVSKVRGFREASGRVGGPGTGASAPPSGLAGVVSNTNNTDNQKGADF